MFYHNLWSLAIMLFPVVMLPCGHHWEYLIIWLKLVDLTWWSSANPDNKVHGANMGPIWARQDPGGPHVGPTDLVIWEYIKSICHLLKSTSIQLTIKLQWFE